MLGRIPNANNRPGEPGLLPRRRHPEYDWGYTVLCSRDYRLIMPSLQQYLEGKIVGLQTQKQHINSRLRIQDFEGQKLVERIAHYAVIELAVSPAGHVSQNDADFFVCLTSPRCSVSFWGSCFSPYK